MSKRTKLRNFSTETRGSDLSNAGYREGEHVYAALGQTEAGRYLVAFFILKADDRALLISARDMTPGERKRHGRK